MKNFGAFWKKTFKYKGTATLGEYWAGVLMLLVPIFLSFILAAMAVIKCLDYEVLYKVICGMSVAFLFIGAVAFIPFVSLTVRRLHAVSKSGWWAGLLLFIGVGLVILMLMCSGFVSTFANFVPNLNFHGCVYGPPEGYDPSQNIVEGVYGPPAADAGKVDSNGNNNPNGEDISNNNSNFDDDINYGDNINSEDDPQYEFDPSYNEMPDVYGPPSYFEDSEENPLIEFDPYYNEMPDVYGPPEMIEDYSNRNYEPDENMISGVYGPPEM